MHVFLNSTRTKVLSIVIYMCALAFFIYKSCFDDNILHNPAIKITYHDSFTVSSLNYLLSGIQGQTSYRPALDIYQQDEYTLKRSFLIDDITNAHRTCSLLLRKDLSKPVFNSYILPYKIFYERSENWRQIIRNRFKNIAVPVDSTDYIPVTRQVMRSLNMAFTFSVHSGPAFIVTASDILSRKGGDCISEATLGAFVLRAFGVPTAIDFTYSFGNINGRMHMWNSIIYSEGKFKPFMAAEKNLDNYNPLTLIADPIDPLFTTYKNAAKVFRRSYTINESNLSLRLSQEIIPSIIRDKRYLDVSRLYFTTSTIKVKLNLTSKTSDSLAYIFVFNSGNWVPVFWAEVDKTGNAIFTDMGRDLLYLIGHYEGEKMIALTSPFILNKAGIVKTLKIESNSYFDLTVASIKSSIQQQIDTMPKIKDMKHFDAIMHHLITMKNPYPPTEGEIYKLYCWNNGWQKLGEERCLNGLIFKKVPFGRLFRVTSDKNSEKVSRVFTYDSASKEQIWW